MFFRKTKNYSNRILIKITMKAVIFRVRLKVTIFNVFK